MTNAYIDKYTKQDGPHGPLPGNETVFNTKKLSQVGRTAGCWLASGVERGPAWSRVQGPQPGRGTEWVAGKCVAQAVACIKACSDPAWLQYRQVCDSNCC